VQVGTDFDEFFRAEHQRLVALAIGLTGVPEAARDLVQDTMTKAYRDWDRVSQLDRPGAWARRVTVNASIDWEGQADTQAWFGDDGRLYGLLDDGETLRLALVGDLPTITSGNAAPVSTEDFGPRGATWVDGLQLELFGRLLDGGTVVAEGVVAAAVIPG
jgi:DNA-directed RNA polymerase specialized sigma24 family protein